MVQPVRGTSGLSAGTDFLNVIRARRVEENIDEDYHRKQLILSELSIQSQNQPALGILVYVT